MELARLPPPPYYAVIFISIRTEHENAEYAGMAEKMIRLAARQDGYLGVTTSARDENGMGTTVSYWRDLEAIHDWKNHVDHKIAQQMGRKKWYKSFRLEVAKVERAHSFNVSEI